MITAYRITSRRFASQIWTGAGARDFGGRWNSKGVPIVYTSQSRSLAAIEQLVHLIKPRVLRGFVVASVCFHERQVRWIEPAQLPKGWNKAVAPASLKRFGDNLVANGKHVAMAVPSVVVAGEWNFLLNPAHKEFGSLAKTSSEPFVFDPRLT